MFPRPARDDGRYRPELAEAVYWIMTASTLARALAEIGLGLWGAGPLRWLVAAGGLGQLAAAALFVVTASACRRRPHHGSARRVARCPPVAPRGAHRPCVADGETRTTP